MSFGTTVPSAAGTGTALLVGGRALRPLAAMMTQSGFISRHVQSLDDAPDLTDHDRGAAPDMVIAEVGGHDPDRDRLRGLFPWSLVIRIPRITMDGMFSMEYRPTVPMVVGGEHVVEMLQRDGIRRTTDAIVDNEIDFRNRERWDLAIESLRRLEARCDVSVSDYLEERHVIQPVMESRDVPSLCVWNHVGREISRLAGRDIVTTTRMSPFQRFGLVMPRELRVFSPFDRAAFGCRYDHDEGWIVDARHMLQRLADLRELRQDVG